MATYREWRRWSVSLLLLLGCSFYGDSASAVINVTADEIWDGILNPRAADGVTLNAGVYTIPEELVIGSGATIFLHDPAEPLPSSSITFDFTGTGGLTFVDATSTIDSYIGNRNAAGTFSLDMNTNPITGQVAGAGQIINGIFVNDDLSGAPMNLNITGDSDIAIGVVNLNRKDARTPAVTISSLGNVNLGAISTSDLAGGGGSGGQINISAESITLGDIDTRSFRNGTAANNGDVILRALAGPNFSPGNFDANTVANNVITLAGDINTNGPTATNNGNLTLTAPKVVLANTLSTDLAANANFVVNAGVVQAGFAEGDLFMNSSSVTPDEVNFSVFHDGVGPPLLEWAANSSGNWRTDSNWNPAGVPDAPSQTALFGSAITDPQTIFINSATTVKTIRFDTASSVSVAGTDVFTLEADTGDASIEVLQGSHQVYTPITLASDATASAAAGAQLDLNSGIDLGGNTLTIAGDGTVNLNNLVAGGSVVNAGSLGIGGGAGIGGDLSSTGELQYLAGSGAELTVSGDALLAGSLIVDLTDGFVAEAGEEFLVLSAGSLTIDDLSLAGPVARKFSLISNSTSLSLVAVSAIPEPSSLLLMLGASVGWVARRRRNQSDGIDRLGFSTAAPARSTAILATLMAIVVCGWASTSSAQIVISDGEIWDGVNNPHAGDGVTLAGGVYTIPQELVIPSGATMFLNNFSDPSNSVTFDFTGTGGLTFTDDTSLIDTYVGDRNLPERFFTLNMNGNNISALNPGAGRIINGIYVLGNQSGDSMSIDINSDADVTIGEINLTRDDARSSRVDVVAGGHVMIDTLISSDISGSASGANGSLSITGRSVTLGDIDPRIFRSDGNGASHDVVITALGPPGFSPGDFSANFAADNVVTLTGDFISEVPNVVNAGGSLTINAVKTVLESTFTADLSEQAGFNVNVGTVQTGFTMADLFVNNSSVTPDSVNFNVFHDGSGPSTLTWAGGNSGNWHSDANWDLNATPNDNTQTAVFGDSLTSSQTIFTNEATTVKGIRFDTTAGIAVAGTSPITLDADTGSATVESLQGSGQVQTGVVLSDNATFSAASGAELSFQGGITQNGNTITVSGDGQVNINNDAAGGDITNTGTLGTAGVTSIGGNLTSSGTLDFDIAGTDTLAFDAWDVSGIADIDGSVIDVELLGGLTLTGSETFTVLTATSLSATGVTLGGAAAGQFSLVINPTSLVLQALTSGGLIGDYNSDGVVDAIDYAVWREALGQNVALPNRDPSQSGVIGTGDFTAWENNYGATSPGQASQIATPEPTALMLVLVALGGVSCRRRR